MTTTTAPPRPAPAPDRRPRPDDPKDCPFYATTMVLTGRFTDPPFRLLHTREGNRCGLLSTVQSPCSQEVEGKPVDWAVCPRMKEVYL